MQQPSPWILIAEDNAVTSSVLKFNLERGGFQLQVASDGQEALDWLGENRADLIITDYQMPQVSGLELIQRVRESRVNRQTPIVLCSAKGLESRSRNAPREIPGRAGVL